jgi:F-type H+-transporting ATPase subunit gamma
MASLRQIRRRMKSIENIHDITKAMEMIAAFRFKKAETRFAQSRPYLLEMEKLIAHLSASAKDLKDPLFENRQALKRKALVVMTGDKGLCGAYNANLLRAALAWANQNKGCETFFIPVGKVGCEFLRKKGAPILSFYPEKSAADFTMAQGMAKSFKDLFLSGKTDSIEVLYTTYRLGGSGLNKIVPFLPLSYLLEIQKKVTFPVDFSKGNVDFGKMEEFKDLDYICEPDFNSVFVSLVSKFLEGKIYLYLLESLTSEYGARMMAMKQATENGEEVLDSLTLLRNKTRQATITRELSEIVGGASVLV